MRNKRSVIQDDHLFVANHLLRKGTRGPVLIKPARKPISELKDRKRARLRMEAEEAAATHLRHRIADNERRYPEIFRQIRSAQFLADYERSTGEPWERRFEADIEEMRFRLLLAVRG